MATETGYWLRIVNGEVSEVWNTTPPSSQKGWIEAVEVKPDITLNREVLTTHSFNLEVTPAQIVWGKRDMEIAERQDSIKTEAAITYSLVVEAELKKEIDDYPTTQYDAAAVAAAQTTYESKIDAVNAATTHDALDAL